jgi:predicted DNA-binding transcriptional regulator AlpA
MSATVHQLPGSPAFVPGERFVSKTELAAHLGFSSRWVNDQMKQGLPKYQIGGRVRFQLSTATAWLMSQQVDQ